MTGNAPLILTVDIGTGSVRAALVAPDGRVTGMTGIAHDTVFPRHGWVEQRPEDWWQGTLAAVRGALGATGAAARVAAIACCGQMHAPVLVDRAGHLVQERVALWNDKRAAELAAGLEAAAPGPINPATCAWPGVKLAWLKTADPRALAAAHRVMMPKDYVNFRLTGVVATDWSEAGSSYLADAGTRGWSAAEIARLGLDPGLMPDILPAERILGGLSAAAAAETGLPAGVPVMVGAGDFPAAILGSGVVRDGMVSDITGTSFLLTRLGAAPMRHPGVMNLGTVTGQWGAFAVIDAAGDAIRWAQRTLDRGARSYAELSAEAAAVAPGAGGLIFLPYLIGERLGQGQASRGAFLGLTARHEAPHLHRAIMEGVVLAMQEAYRPISDAAGRPEAIVSAAGGARSGLWLQIKADVFGCPVIPVEEPEAGLVGSAALAFAGLGRFGSPAEAAAEMVRHHPPILPDPAAARVYAGQADAFAGIRRLMPEANLIMGQLT